MLRSIAPKIRRLGVSQLGADVLEACTRVFGDSGVFLKQNVKLSSSLSLRQPMTTIRREWVNGLPNY